MTYDWYKIVNLAEFEALDLVSKEYEFILEGVGLKTVMVVKGRLVGLVYEGVLLSIGVTEDNPFEFEDLAVYLDAAGDIHLGILNES